MFTSTSKKRPRIDKPGWDEKVKLALKAGYARVNEKGEVVATWKLPKQIGAGLLTIAGMVALVAAGRALILFMFFVLAMLIVAAPSPTWRQRYNPSRVGQELGHSRLRDQDDLLGNPRVISAWISGAALVPPFCQRRCKNPPNAG